MAYTTTNPRQNANGTLNIAGFLARSTVNGPGTRAVLWVQGCPRQCSGCFNAAYRPFSPVTRVAPLTLAQQILAIPGIDGVTFSGGEPFAQAGPLAQLGEILRGRGLSVVTYSGYTVGELAAGEDPAWPALLAATDLLIAGPFVAELARPDLLKGSANQEVILLGNRIHSPHAGDEAEPFPVQAEFTILPDGTIAASGFPASGLLTRLASRCGGA